MIVESSIKINDKTSKVNLNEIPPLSGVSIKLFEQYGTETNISRINFGFTAIPLSEMREQLQSAKESPVKHTIFAALRVIAIVAVVAIGILGIMSPIAPVSIGVSSAAFYFVLSLYNANRVNFEPKNWALLLFTLVGGPIFPIYERITKISRLENKISSLEKTIDTCFKERFNFFTNDHSALLKKIVSDIEFLKDSKTEEAIKGRLVRIKALDELNKGIAYFSQFKDVVA